MIDNGGCDHNCCNTGNNYYCTCNDGYVLSSDGNTCQGKEFHYFKKDIPILTLSLNLHINIKYHNKYYA